MILLLDWLCVELEKTPDTFFSIEAKLLQAIGPGEGEDELPEDESMVYSRTHASIQ